MVTTGSLLYDLFQIIDKKEYTQSQWVELSLNLMTNGELILFNHSLNYCRTNVCNAHKIQKQLHAIRKMDGSVELRPSGCDCTKFASLTKDDLPDDWQAKVVVRPGQNFRFRPASSC